MADSITSPMDAEHNKGLSDLVGDLFHPLEADGLRSRVLARLFNTGSGDLRLGRYHVLEAIGRGAMGTVYAAYDDKLDRKVAIKILHASATDSETRERLLREARALARLSHPHVVQVHDAGELDDKVFVAMEFVAGTTLRAWLDDQPRASATIIARFCEAGEGLAAAHEAGVVHRDFKPENVLVGETDGRVRVADFGLAFATLQETREAIAAVGDTQLEQRVLTRTGLVLGTPAYMAPEQLQGERVDPRTDQFSFAVALHEALYGQRPFRGDTLASLSAAIEAGPASAGAKSGVPSCVRTAIARALAYAPEDRFGSMRELLAALSSTTRRSKRTPIIIAAAAAAIIGPLAIVAGSTSPERDLERSAIEAKLAISESAHARERDAEHLADAATRIELDSTAAALELARIAPEGWTPEASELLSLARVRGVATRVFRFDHEMKPLDARAGWIRWEEATDKALPQSRPWQALAYEAVGAATVPAPRSGTWPDAGGPLLSYYEQARGLQAWPLDGTAVRDLSSEGDHREAFLAVDPRGEFAALYRDDVLAIYDVATGSSERHTWAGIDVATAALAPGGRELAHVTADGRLVRRDFDTGRESIVGDALAGVLRYSADGRWLGGQAADGRLALLDRTTGELLATPDDPISAFTFSPFGDRIVTCPSTKVEAAATANVWELPSFAALEGIGARPLPGCQVDFSADGGIVVVAAPGQEVHALDLRSGENFHPLGGPRLAGATVSPDGSTLTTLHDGEVRVWSLAHLRDTTPVPNFWWMLADVAYVDAESMLLTQGRGARLLDRRTGKSTDLVPPKGILDSEVTAKSPLEPIAVAMTNAGVVWAEMMADGGVKLVRPERDPEVVLASQQVQTHLLAPDGTLLFAFTKDGQLWIHDIRRGKERRAQQACPDTLPESGLWRRNFATARDGSRVSAATQTGGLCIWDTATGKMIVQRGEQHGSWTLSPDLALGIHSPGNLRDPDRLIDLDRGTVIELPSETKGVAVTTAGVVVYAQQDVLWAWDPAEGDRWPLEVGSRMWVSTLSHDDRELALHGARRGLRFVSLDRPAALGPGDAAALTELVTLEPAKLR